MSDVQSLLRLTLNGDEAASTRPGRPRGSNG